MNENNKKKTIGYYLGTCLGVIILGCIVACVGSIFLAATVKFLTWLWLLVL